MAEISRTNLSDRVIAFVVLIAIQIALLVLDRILISVFNRNRPRKAMAEWGLIDMAGILGITGFMFMKRKKATA